MMVTAEHVLKIWSFRLEMNRKGTTTWSPSLRVSVENFVERLKTLSPDEVIELDFDMNRDPIAKFIRKKTGEVLGEINKVPEEGS